MSTYTEEQKSDILSICNDETKTHIERLDAIVEYKKKHLGLKSVSFSAYTESPNAAEDVAKAYVDIERRRALGTLKETDVTDEVL